MLNSYNNLLIEYYKKYYKDTLGIPDFDFYIQQRLKEDDTYLATIKRFKHLIPFFYLSKKNKKVLIDGAGTGQELISFLKMGYNTYGIEPNHDAIQIIKCKCNKYQFDADRIIKAYAESLPFKNSFFDLVWSWTVLEHVKDYKKQYLKYNVY
jgi:ubiquinone/menaquinone biosynthesis C-methylase UbiE